MAFILEPGIDTINVATNFYSYDTGLEEHIAELSIYTSPVNTFHTTRHENIVAQLVPNPSQNVHLLLIVSKATDLQWAVFDVSGKLISQENQFFDKGKHQIPLQLPTSYSSGVYLVKVFDFKHEPVLFKWIRI